MSQHHKEFLETLRGAWSVETWLKQQVISQEHIKKYPNAAKAAEIKASPLGKALE